MKKILTSLACVLACSASFNAMAGGDIEAGKAAVAKYACTSCHGADLSSPIDPSYPKLAGQHPEYLAHALMAYQRGSAGANANGRMQPIMGGMVKDLTSKEIHDIAAYIGSLPGSLVVVTESKFIQHAKGD
ncbi:MAG TPA: cytochrome c [Burkholderiaceae bacterium]|jgi:cytochrome c553|nr:cytochrome c [Burkholderiaceae bacterium]